MIFPFQKSNRSAFENFLLAKYEMFTGAARVNSLPYYLGLDPSDACQLRCPTCPTGVENESRRHKDVETTIYRKERYKLSDELCDAVLEELGDVLFLVMFYNYGEPFLNPRLPQLIGKAKAYDITTEVHSNLSLPLSDERIDAVLSSGLDRLSSSVDGFTQAAYEVHRVGGDVDLVKKNLERLAKAKDRLGVETELIYKFLVFKHNEQEVELARQFSEDIGITFIHGDAFITDPSWLPSHRANEAPYYSESEMTALIERWERDGRGDYFFENERHLFWSLFPKTLEASMPQSCAWHYGFSVVTAGGPVAPCCAASKDVDDFGTVRPGEVRFADVWNNEKYQKSRQSLAGTDDERLRHVDSVCTRCYFPKFIQHLYSVYDGDVAARFDQLFGATEPAMAKAFELLKGMGGGADSQPFVEHFESALQASWGS